MKTITTVLPIYDKVAKQCFERGKRGGVDRVIPIVTPRHRLPSFQWLDYGDGCTSVTTIELIEKDLTATDITTYFVALPTAHEITGDTYFSYDGDTLNYLLDEGIYYLQITMDNDLIYYSEWFQVDCVYENLIITWFDRGAFPPALVTDGIDIDSLMDFNLTFSISSGTFNVKKGETLKFRGLLTLNLPTIPLLQLRIIGGAAVSDAITPADGLNEIDIEATSNADNVALYLYTNEFTGVNISFLGCYLYRDYSEKYITLNFSNTCDLGNILYSEGFSQTLWIESEPMEMTFPQEDKGIENGEGKFIRTFARQVKKYLLRTKELPDYMVEVFNRMKLHDTVEITDLVGDTNDVYNLEVEHEWLWDDRYYAKCDLTFDYDEVFVINGCCNNLT